MKGVRENSGECSPDPGCRSKNQVQPFRERSGAL